MAEVVVSKPPPAYPPDEPGSSAVRPADGAWPGVPPEGQPPGPAEGPAAAATRAGAPPARYADVWSRTEPKFRLRAVVLLLVNFLLFCGVCVFTYWLHADRLFDFSWNSYLAPLKFWGEQTLNLNDFVLYPISVEQNPTHGVVLGLLVAAMIAVPISVAMLYRFPCALPFTAAVAVFAHLPWLAFTLVWSCVLAAVKPFRLSFRFGAALAGMLPVLLYLYLATRGTPTQLGTYTSPEQKLLLGLPWILAIIAACTMLGATLGIARLVKYHPGAVAPVVAVMFVAPAILFHEYVGVDEVSYRVLEAEYGPRSARFGVLDLREKLPELLKTRLEQLTPEELLDLASNPEHLTAWHGRLREQLLHWLQRGLLADRRIAYEECKAFIANFPESRYLPCVLYIQGWVLDLRLAAPKSLGQGGAVRREMYSDFPHVQSEDTWLALVKSYPTSPLAGVARLRLAQLLLRRGEVDGALKLLQPQDRAAPSTAATQSSTQPAPRRWLPGGTPEASLAFTPEPHRREGQRWYELVRGNVDDSRYGGRAIRELACLDPRRPGYREQLLRLAERYRDAPLHDNLMVLWAASLPEREQRAAALEACVRDYPAGDALPEALLHLAELEMQARPEDQESRQRGLARMKLVAERHGPTYWGRQAAERLRAVPVPPELSAAARSTP